VTESTSGVEALGAREGAHTNLVAFAKLHVSTELLETLVGVLIARVDNPPVGLHEHSRTQVVLGMPPVARAGGLARGAEDALVKSVE